MASDVAAASHKPVDTTEELDGVHDSNATRELSSASPLTGGNSSSTPPSDAPSAEAIIKVDEIVIQPRGKLNLPALYIPSASASDSSSPPPSPAKHQSPLALSIPSLDKTQKVGRRTLRKSAPSALAPPDECISSRALSPNRRLLRHESGQEERARQAQSGAAHPDREADPVGGQPPVRRDAPLFVPDSRVLLLDHAVLHRREFFSFLRRQEKHRLSEAHAKFYASEVLIALEYLHLLGIVYRDLKPENILVHESGHIMLSDFDLAHELKSKSGVAASPTSSFMNVTGFSSRSSSPVGNHENSLWFRVVDRKKSTISPNALPATRSPSLSSCLPFPKCLCGTPTTYPMMDTESHMEMGEKRTSFVGTHEYVAPEIIAEEGYMGSVDWWAFGILLYEMIYGTTPFKGSTQIQTLESILDLSEEIDFPQEVDVSEDYKKPPIVPDFVHTLKEKQFSIDEIDAFDDEVPYARGVSSPNTPRRKRPSLSTTPCASPRTIPPGSPENLQFTLDATPATTTAVSEAPHSPPHSPNKRTSQANISDQATVICSDAPAADGNANLPDGDTTVEGESPVTLHNFDYAGGSKPGYWSSAESSRTLHQKLSEMRLAVPEEELSESQCE